MDNSTVAVLISFVGLLTVCFGFIIKITSRLTALESRSDIFWKVLEPHMAAIIHSPDHRNRDELVDKLVNNQMTLEEAEALVCLLEANIKENHNESKKLASVFLLARVKGLIRGGKHK